MYAIENVTLELDNGKEIECNISFEIEDDAICLGPLTFSSTGEDVSEEVFDNDRELYLIINKHLDRIGHSYDDEP